MGKWAMPLCLLAAGCASLPSWTAEEPTAQVASHPFSNDPARSVVKTKANYAPANADVALRVDRVGRELIAANPQAGLRPLFGTIGAPAPEIFHVGTQTVYVTEGLVKQCATDRELTAILASELGRMISEREAGVGRPVRDPDGAPPVELPIGGHGYAGDADPIHQIELGNFEKSHPRRRTLLPPDPNVVARALLEHAGFQPADLQAVQPLLQAAERSGTLEQQFKGTAPQSGWRP